MTAIADTDTTTALDLETGGGMTTESATDEDTAREAANTGEVTTALSLEETVDQVESGHDQGRVPETTAGAVPREADHHTRLRGGETERWRLFDMLNPTK